MRKLVLLCGLVLTLSLSAFAQDGDAKAVDGRFNRLRWLMVWLTQGIFYGLCWLPWEVSGQLRQAVLFDIAHEKLYLFGLVLWPQDALLLALVLLMAATGLFQHEGPGGQPFWSRFTAQGISANRRMSENIA